MATIIPVVNRTLQGAGSIAITTWTLGNADTGVQVSMSDMGDRSVQVEGTFGGATVTVQGSNDNVNWETLRDPGTIVLTYTVAGLKQVLEMTIYIRVISAGGVGTALTCTMASRQMFPAAWSA